MAEEVVDAIVAHLGRDRLVGDAESPAEAAALIGPIDLDQLEPPYRAQHLPCLREVRLGDAFGRPRVAKTPDGGATVVQPHLVREAWRPGEVCHLQVVMKELDQLPRPAADLPNLRRLLDRVEMTADVMNATGRRPDDRVEVLEAADEVCLGGGGLFLAAAVGHRLPAASLFERVLDRATEPFEEFQRRYAHFREEGVDVAGYEEADLHWRAPPLVPDMRRLHREEL